MHTLIVGVRFADVGKQYHFDAAQIPEIRVGDRVIVDTTRGRQIGEVVSIVDQPDPKGDGFKSVERLATPRDLVLRKIWQQKEPAALIACRERASQLRLAGVKFVTAEYSFDGTRLTFIFSTDSDEKPELQSLRRDMQKHNAPAQVEFRQIGPRDAAKILGGMGACGLETRCCSKFLTEFSPISIKMAKEQGISLTPTEITGICGRLRCCLIYEYDQYVAARKELPKKNKRVTTPSGDGKIVDINPLLLTVRVELSDGQVSEFHRDELEPWDELEALRRKSKEPCADDCNCPTGENKREHTA
ncbi:MAG: regulatory iron-sulfur-containing complex subunit RicT [Chloroflexota bacterium]